MTTHQLYLNQENETENASGVAVIFFLLGAPNIYSVLRQRSHSPVMEHKTPIWAVGLGILAFSMSGSWLCFNAMG